uniref:Farnesoic acid O-methyl transferase domain-containing protein n=1 Tax=Anopheles dirus TaxID=7168 RepID=A0A9I3EI79_9DIPT
MQLQEVSTVGLLHRARPLMFKLEVFDNAMVTLTKDGESNPFIQFGGNTVPPEYIAFLRFNADVVYFYDCPLENKPTATIGSEDAVLLRCGSAPQSNGRR